MNAEALQVDVDVDVDVVIVGAGPTGLMSALLLADRGHEVALVEKWPEPYPLPRAVGINHETLRALQRAKVIDYVRPNVLFTADGSRVRQVMTADGEVLSVRTDSATSPSGWPERASFYQPDFERTLNERAVLHPRVNVLRGWNATRVVDGTSGVTVEAVRHGDGETGTLRARGRYVIGCDGANSIVRVGELTDVDDLGFAYDWLVVDIVPHAVRSFTPNLGQILGPPRPTTMVGGGPRRRRWEFMRLDGETAEELNQPEAAWRLLAPFDVRPDNATLERHAVYTFRALWATRWRAGRAMLAGDAAHLMPPFLGEGFNSGVRDAMAVTWRLDLILRSLAPDSLLDSYTTERIAHVREIIEQAVQLGRMICITDPDEAEARNARLRATRDQQVVETRPAPWRLGDGAWMSSDAHAGYLGVQGRVARDGTEGRFDDVVPNGGFVLVSAGEDPAPMLSPETGAAWAAIGGACVHFGTGSPIADVDGTYAAWFAEREIGLALFRPDFYVFGTAPSVDGADRLVRNLIARLGVTPAIAR